VLKVWRAGVATVAVALLSSALIVFDLSDGAFRRWWSARAFTTDAIAGILVVLLTVLIVNQALGIRRDRERFRATAAQASIVLGQAIRTTRAVLARTTSGDRTAASDELRTYMIMLMIAAPILIESKTPRAFLEDAKHWAVCWSTSNIRSRGVPLIPSRLMHSLKKRCGSSKSARPRCLQL
jgi:hypothetical protein